MDADDLDSIELPAIPKDPAPEKSETLADPKVDPKVDAKPAEPPKPAAEAKPEVKLEAKSTEGQPKSESPAEDPGDILKQLEANKGAIIKHLAGERFALSKEETDALDINPTEAIPQLLARAFYESQVATINQIHRMVPTIVSAVTSSMQTATDAERGFYDANKDIIAKDHGNVVAQYARVFRQANPQASRDEAYKFVAAAVRAHFGIVPGPVAGNGAAPAARRAVPAPFAPARGGAKVISQTPIDDNPFGGMGQEFDD